jgi:ferredoxin
VQEDFDPGAKGIFPQRRVEVRVDPTQCVGCGACVMHAPGTFQMNRQGKAEVIVPLQNWSPLDGHFVRNCPTYAITARLAGPGRRSTIQLRTAIQQPPLTS